LLIWYNPKCLLVEQVIVWLGVLKIIRVHIIRQHDVQRVLAVMTHLSNDILSVIGGN
jgi:hypothetical protein